MPRKIVGHDEYSGRNTLTCYVGDMQLWFSYGSVVAFHDGRDETPETGGKIVVSMGSTDGVANRGKGGWSQTTTQHINAIESGPEVHLERVDFLCYVASRLEAHDLGIEDGDAE